MKSMIVWEEGSSTGSFMRVYMTGSKNSSGASSNIPYNEIYN